MNKKNEKLRKKIETLLSTASSKADYLQIKEMMDPYKYEIGIQDLYSNVNQKIRKIEEAEEVALIMAKADKATTLEEYDEIISELCDISFGNSLAQEKIGIMQEKFDQLFMKEQFNQVMTRAENANSLEEYDAVIEDLGKLQSLDEAVLQKKLIEEKKSQLVAEIHKKIKDMISQIETLEEWDLIMLEIEELPASDKQQYNKLISIITQCKNTIKELNDKIEKLEQEKTKYTSFFKRKERDEIQKQIILKQNAKELNVMEALSELKKLS